MLLSRAGAGDRDAFMRLYQRYEKRVYGLVVTLIGRGAAADDAFQDAMWEIWRRASTYDPRLGSAASWILMLARSRAIDTARRRTRINKLNRTLAERAQASAGSGGAESFAATGLDGRQGSESDRGFGEDHLDVADLGNRASRLLATLPKEQGEVVRMAFMQGLTREQIAQALGIPVGTVKTRIRTAVRTLSGAMAAQTDDVEAGEGNGRNR
jgi:RNA polymerase sigma-70 factor (ECF subfamily)